MDFSNRISRPSFFRMHKLNFNPRLRSLSNSSRSSVCKTLTQSYIVRNRSKRSLKSTRFGSIRELIMIVVDSRRQEQILSEDEKFPRYLHNRSERTILAFGLPGKNEKNSPTCFTLIGFVPFSLCGARCVIHDSILARCAIVKTCWDEVCVFG